VTKIVESHATLGTRDEKHTNVRPQGIGGHSSGKTYVLGVSWKVTGPQISPDMLLSGPIAVVDKKSGAIATPNPNQVQTQANVLDESSWKIAWRTIEKWLKWVCT